MLLHLAKFASMFGLKSSAGSYEKMQNECSLDSEHPFCPQVGVSVTVNGVQLGRRGFYLPTFRSVGIYFQVCHGCSNYFLSDSAENTF